MNVVVHKSWNLCPMKSILYITSTAATISIVLPHENVDGSPVPALFKERPPDYHMFLMFILFAFLGAFSALMLQHKPRVEKIFRISAIASMLSALAIVFNAAALCSSDSDRVLELQSRSKSSIIHLDDHSVSCYLTSTKTPRPYYLLIFFDATQLRIGPGRFLATRRVDGRFRPGQDQARRRSDSLASVPLHQATGLHRGRDPDLDPLRDQEDRQRRDLASRSEAHARRLGFRLLLQLHDKSD
ncbi:hypothetical protein CMV_002308 [Castanea mollissima]|uniref:Uncharacterized protein n=1 Tax=Castanea mollissima TaxID=60419 RepID=A0A8J4RQD5_9ROSI|nr:hypothetical protein CMV_002308 [Castanea mollissima]